VSVRGSPQYLANGAKRSAVEFAKRFRREVASRTKRKGLVRRVTLTKQTVSYHAFLHFKVPKKDPYGFDLPIEVANRVQELARYVAKIPGFKWPNTFLSYATIRVRVSGMTVRSAGLRAASGGGGSPPFGPTTSMVPQEEADSRKSYYNAKMHISRDLTSFGLAVENWLSYHAANEQARLLSFRLHYLSTHPKPKPKKRNGKGSKKATTKARR
jgi:hypothetical protein